jgi:diaminopimelate epimerase
MEAKLSRGEFAKYHALGNDYIVVDSAALGLALTAARVRRICNRHTGVGSDGILALTPSGSADFGLRIFNPDGSEAEKSGNGLRIFARFLHDFGYTRRRRFAIATAGGLAPAELRITRGRVQSIVIGMGRATFRSEQIPLRGRHREVLGETLRAGGRTFEVTCVSVGNPHCVVFLSRLDVDDLRRFGPLLERHHLFPNRTNVQFARVRSRRVVDVLIWERGAGETLASGSSATAVAAAAHRHGLVGAQVTVRMPGGTLQIGIDDDLQLQLSGHAEPVCRGRLIAAL